MVLVAVNQNGFALYFASEILHNNLFLLNLLHNFFNLPKNKQWLEERMKVRDILVEQDLLRESIPDKKKPFKLRSLKF